MLATGDQVGSMLGIAAGGKQRPDISSFIASLQTPGNRLAGAQWDEAIGARIIHAGRHCEGLRGSRPYQSGPKKLAKASSLSSAPAASNTSAYSSMPACAV
jgi:hypothetical protein